MTKFRISLMATVATLVLMMALTAPGAFAQSSQDGYIQAGPAIVDQTDDDGDGGGELPFTGVDIGLLAAAGGSLLLLGVGMRRLTRAPDSI